MERRGDGGGVRGCGGAEARVWSGGGEGSPRVSRAGEDTSSVRRTVLYHRRVGDFFFYSLILFENLFL